MPPSAGAPVSVPDEVPKEVSKAAPKEVPKPPACASRMGRSRSARFPLASRRLSARFLAARNCDTVFVVCKEPRLPPSAAAEVTALLPQMAAISFPMRPASRSIARYASRSDWLKPKSGTPKAGPQPLGRPRDNTSTSAWSRLRGAGSAQAKTQAQQPSTAAPRERNALIDRPHVAG